MGRGSSKGRNGLGGGAMRDTGVENGMIMADSMTIQKVQDIVDTIKPDSSGLVPFGAMDKAGASLNKMMSVGDQLVITYANGGDQRIYEKTGNNSFRQGQFTYNPTNIGNEIAAAKYPNPNLSANKITVTINKKLPTAQNDAVKNVTQKVVQGGGNSLKFSIHPDGGMTFVYKRTQGLVTGTISKTGQTKIMSKYTTG